MPRALCGVQGVQYVGSLLVALCLCASVAGSQTYDRHDYPFAVKPYAVLTNMFDYAPSTPLEPQQRLVIEHAGVSVFDLSFRVPADNERTSAYLVVPSGKGPFPAVILLNSAGEREGFLPTAILLARTGVVALALEPLEGPPFAEHMKHDLMAVRRGFDLLAARGDVDAKRIGCVGHSRGGMLAAVVAGVDHRFKCFVIEGANLGMTYHFRFSRHPFIAGIRQATPARDFQKTMEEMAPFDAVHYIGHAAPAALLFQSARFDLGVSERESADLFAAASEPKQLRWYETGHEMGGDPAAVKDRVEFLSQQLGFSLRP